MSSARSSRRRTAEHESEDDLVLAGEHRRRAGLALRDDGEARERWAAMRPSGKPGRTSRQLDGYRSINELAETVNGYDKAELVRGSARSGPWRCVEDVELATLGSVQWHNTELLHGYGDVPPAEFENSLYATQQGGRALAGISGQSLHQTQGDSHQGSNGV